VAWLFRAVRNAAISAGRSRRRRERHEQRAAEKAAGWFEADVGARLDAATAEGLLNRLPTPEREVIIAHLWGGLTFEEVGALVGVSSSSAHRLFVKGLEALRRQLGEVHVDPRE
jgi:RNA polymerase sigma-70 factor (ECF subfamily)